MSAARGDGTGRGAEPEPVPRAAFPWDEAQRAVFGLLRLSPRDFWALTPRELAMALAPFLAHAPGPPDRASLDALMRRFPDTR